MVTRMYKTGSKIWDSPLKKLAAPKTNFGTNFETASPLDRDYLCNETTPVVKRKAVLQTTIFLAHAH